MLFRRQMNTKTDNAKYLSLAQFADHWVDGHFTWIPVDEPSAKC